MIYNGWREPRRSLGDGLNAIVICVYLKWSLLRKPLSVFLHGTADRLSILASWLQMFRSVGATDYQDAIDI